MISEYEIRLVIPLLLIDTYIAIALFIVVIGVCSTARSNTGDENKPWSVASKTTLAATSIL